MTTIETRALKRRIAALERALWVYANPDTYFAVSFLFDPPCGQFRDDFSRVPWSDYDRPMPGKLARRVLREQIKDAVARSQLTQEDA